MDLSKLSAPNAKVVFAKTERNPIAYIPMVLLVLILCACFYPVNHKFFAVCAVPLGWYIIYLLRNTLIPQIVLDSTNKIRQGKNEEAIPLLIKGIELFEKRAWLDKYRFLLMISTSKNSYYEILNCNLAWCLMQTGEVKKSIEVYEMLLKQYPDNALAISSLKSIRIVQSSTNEQ